MKRPLLPVLLVSLLSGCVGIGSEVGALGSDRLPSAQPEPGLRVPGPATPPSALPEAETVTPPLARQAPRLPARSFAIPILTAPAAEPRPGSRLGSPIPTWPLSGRITLGRTIDELAQSHALVLNLNPGVQGTLARTSAPLAVVSGSTMFSVAGDAAVNDWRFVVDSSATGNAAPIIVFKYATGTMEDLAQDPTRFASSAELNEDVNGTFIRLQALIATVISNAQLPDGAATYTRLAQNLQDSSWTGVLIFNASASVPGEALGQSTGALAGTDIAAFDIGFQENNTSGASRGVDAFFGTVDYAAAPGSQYLRALFTNNALTFFEMG